MGQKHHVMHGRDHLPTGADPIPGFPGLTGDSILDIIMSKSPVGLWKLDETAGNTAADSSGAGNDMTVPNGSTSYVAPTWGEPAGPPGTTAAAFALGVGVTAGTRLSVAMPTGMVDDFSAGLWVYTNHSGLGHGELIGQGGPIHGTNLGWMLFYDPGTFKFSLRVRGGTGNDLAVCNSASAAGVWCLFGVSRVAGTWTLYLDGLAQTDTSTVAPSAVTATWLGDCGEVTANHGSNLTMSWAFITDTPLDGTDWLDLYNSGLTGGLIEQDLVWTSNGDGTASWRPNLETIAKDGDTPLTGDVTLSEGANVTLTQTGQDIEIAATSGGSPTGAAGGALDGSYPNPGLAASVAGAGLAETSNVLSVNVDGSTLEVASDTLRVKDDGITAAKIAADAVGTSEIATDAVTSSEIAADAVGSSEIAAGAVGSSELADTTVTPGSYGDATHVGQFTVDQDGRLTAATSVAITGSSGDPADDPTVWMPLSTVTGGVPELVWDADDSLIPTLTPI